MTRSDWIYLLQRALGMFLKHPLVLGLAVGTWGLKFVELTSAPLALFTTILGWLLGPAFFASIVVVAQGKERINLHFIGASIKRFTVGVTVIIMVYTIPLLLIIPLLDALLPISLEGNIAVIILGFGPTVVPSIAAIWSLVLRRTPLIDAVYDGIRLLKGVWLPAIIVGVGYQASATGAGVVREWLLQDTVLLVLFEALWIAAEACLRIAILLWLFDELRDSAGGMVQPKSSKVRK